MITIVYIILFFIALILTIGGARTIRIATSKRIREQLKLSLTSQFWFGVLGGACLVCGTLLFYFTFMYNNGSW